MDKKGQNWTKMTKVGQKGQDWTKRTKSGQKGQKIVQKGTKLDKKDTI